MVEWSMFIYYSFLWWIFNRRWSIACHSSKQIVVFGCNTKTYIFFAQYQQLELDLQESLHQSLFIDDADQHASKQDVIVTNESLCSALVDVCGLPLLASSTATTTSPPLEEEEFVLTETSQRNMSAVALALCRGAPVWLQGPR